MSENETRTIDLATMQAGDKIDVPNGGNYEVIDYPKRMSPETQRAIASQTIGMNIPGYGGFIPGKMSLSLFGGSVADVARRCGEQKCAQAQQWRTMQYNAPPPPPPKLGDPPSTKKPWHVDEPCKTNIQGPYVAPHIPGYLGYIPAKRCSPMVMGKSPIGALQQCARVVAERDVEKTFEPKYTIGKLGKHANNGIPGYSGHYPGKKEIFGCAFRRGNTLGFERACQDRHERPVKNFLYGMKGSAAPDFGGPWQ